MQFFNDHFLQISRPSRSKAGRRVPELVPSLRIQVGVGVDPWKRSLRSHKFHQVRCPV